MNYLMRIVSSLFSSHFSSHGAKSDIPQKISCMTVNGTGHNTKRNPSPCRSVSSLPKIAEERRMSQLECELQCCMRKARQCEMENPNAIRQLTQRKIEHILIKCTRRHTKGQACTQCGHGAAEAAHRKPDPFWISHPVPLNDPRSPDVTSVCHCGPNSCDTTPDRCGSASTSGRLRPPSRRSASDCQTSTRSKSREQRSMQTVISSRHSKTESGKTAERNPSESKSQQRHRRSSSLNEGAAKKRKPSRARAKTSRKRKVK